MLIDCGSPDVVEWTECFDGGGRAAIRGEQFGEGEVDGWVLDDGELLDDERLNEEWPGDA